MKNFTIRFLPIGLLVMLCFSFNSYAQQNPNIVSVTGRLVRTTPRLADIDRNSMYGQPFVITRDENGVIGIGNKLEETEERIERKLRNASSARTTEALQSPSRIFPQVPGTTLGVNFNGQTSPGLSPTDNNMAVGPNHVIQIVNNSAGSQFTIWNKSGTVVQGATTLASITGLPGFGDPVVLYDQLANRWLMAEFGPNTTPLHNLNIAVSVTADPTGAWKIYQYIDASFFCDYPKYSVWHNGYYATTNDFNNAGTTYLGSSVYAFDRAAMIAGAATATMIRVRQNNGGQNYYNMGTVGLEGNNPSSQNGLFAFPIGPTTMNLFEFTPDFVVPANSVVGPLIPLTIAAYATPPGSVAQQGSGTLIQTLGERMMFKLNYRNNAGTESIVMTHTVGNGALAAVRWYELRRIAGNWTVYQQGTITGSDGNSRFMGGISMDGCGNIALMYDKSGTTSFPSMMYTGRNASDPLGTMTLPEQTIINGASAHTNARWGDYNTTVNDYPNNGSFWSTSQYGAQLTRVANYTLTGGCVPAPNIVPTTATLVSESCSPANGVIDPGETVTVSFCAHNTGGVNTANLVGTLQASGGIIPISGPQNYGVLLGGGADVCRNFTFTNSNPTCGSSIIPSIQWQDGGTNYGTTSYASIPLGVLSTAPLGNGGFETGTLASWTILGTNPTPVVNATAPHSGTYAAFLGNLPGTEPLGDASIYQQITVPASGGTLTYWYQPYTEDGITFDWQDAYITNTSGAILATIMHVCSTGPYTQVNYNMAAFAGQTVRLEFLVHQDGFGDVTNMYVDDISISQYTCCAVPCTITCPGNISVGNSPGLCGANVNFPNAVTNGLCGPITYSRASGSFFPLGTTPVTATVSGGGPSCTFNVTVTDVQPPTITCPANITVSCANAVPVPNTASVTATDNCPGVVVTFVSDVISAQTCANRYTITRTYKATDAVGLTATCAQTITVNDVTAPVITCPANMTVTTPLGSCTAVVTYAPTATDNCAGVVTIVNSPVSGSVFPLGTTTVNSTATDVCGNSSTCSFTVTVLDGQLPVISVQPANQTVCAGSNAVFSVVSTNALSYQWQAWNGSAWVNIPGSTASSITIPAAPLSINTSTYRVNVIGLCTTVTSAFATLYVNSLPTVSIAASRPPVLLPGQSLTITATVSPAGGSFVWYKNGVIIAGASGGSLNGLTVDDAGTYKVVYTDGNGCVSTSADLTISAQPSGNLYVYPNPNTGQFDVRFYNTANEKATINIYDEKGARIYSRAFTTAIPYTRLHIDLTRFPNAKYLVEVVNSADKRVGAKWVIIER